MAPVEEFARLALETYSCGKIGDIYHYNHWRERTLEQGELLRVTVTPFRKKGTALDRRQRIRAEADRTRIF